MKELTKRVFERALEVERSDHLGYEKGDPGGWGSGNNRNGGSSKTLLTDAGPLDDSMWLGTAMGTTHPRVGIRSRPDQQAARRDP
ncbi:MAG: transposase [Acidimicrobiales bacterium]